MVEKKMENVGKKYLLTHWELFVRVGVTVGMEKL
jgi:hypothetical protein